MSLILQRFQTDPLGRAPNDLSASKSARSRNCTAVSMAADWGDGDGWSNGPLPGLTSSGGCAFATKSGPISTRGCCCSAVRSSARTFRREPTDEILESFSFLTCLPPLRPPCPLPGRSSSSRRGQDGGDGQVGDPEGFSKSGLS